MASVVRLGLAALLVVALANCLWANNAGRESRSILFRATHILLVHIESADPGEWSVPDHLVRTRTNALRLRWEKTLKGKVSFDTVVISVKQSEPAIPRRFAVPGVWSGKRLASGEQYLVFANSRSTNAGVILQETSTLEVLEAEQALIDVELALDSERGHWTLSQAVAHARDRSGSLGPLFAQYLATRLARLPSTNVVEFDAVMAFVEAPALSSRFRQVLLSEVYANSLMNDPVPDKFAARLAVASFHILARPDAGPLREDLISTLLPNLVGLKGGARKQTAADVFRDFPADREKAEQILTADTAPAAAYLLHWLRQTSGPTPGKR